MSLFKKMSAARKAALAVLAAALVWVAAARVLLLLPVSKSLLFLGFQLLFVALPGAALLKLFAVKTTPLESLCAAYGLGLLAVIAVYFLFIPLGFGSYVVYGLLALAAVSAAVLFFCRRRAFSGAADSGELKLGLGVAMVGGVLTFVLLSMSNLPPDITGPRTYFHDMLYGVNLITSAARSFPMQSMMMSGVTAIYHIFYYSYGALLYLVVGLPAFQTATQLSLITLAPFAAACFAALARRCCKTRWAMTATTLIFVLVPSFYLSHNMNMDLLGFPLGMAYCTLAPVFFFAAQEQSNGLNRLHLLSAVLLLGALGAKGPLAVSVLFGICFALLLELIRKRNLWVFPKGLLYAVPFLLLFLLLYNGGSSVGDSMSISPFYSAIRTEFTYWLEKLPLPGPLTLCLGVVQYVLALSPMTSLCVLLTVICMVRCKRPSDLSIFAVGAFLEAAVMINLFKQSGSSELYFLSGVYPVLLIAGFAAAERIHAEKPFKKTAAALVAAAAVLCLLKDANTTVRLLTGTSDEDRFPVGVPAAVQYSVFRQGEEKEMPENQAQAAVTTGDYAAYLWLRENTPQDAVIVSYRYSLNSLYFYGSCFSERPFYLEGWSYLTQNDTNHFTPEKVNRDTYIRFFFATQDESYARVLAMQGCDYLMLDRAVCGDWELSDTYVEQVFQNEATTIYKIKEFQLD